MSLATLADLLLRSSLLMLLVWLAAAGVRRAGGSAAMRHTIWLLGLGGLVLVPVLAAMMPPMKLPILPESLSVAAPLPGLPVAELSRASMPSTPLDAAIAAPTATIGLGDLMQLLYVAVAAGLLGRLAIGHWLLARLWRQARTVDAPQWAGFVDSLRSSLGIGRPVELRFADRSLMPMTWGSVRPRILLPGDARGWDEERARIVLLHELAHVARRDSLSRAAASVVSAIYWFNPAIWYAARQMRREQEHACDDLVLSRGAKAGPYARNLLEAARAFRTPPAISGFCVAMASKSELERRLTAIVRSGSRRRAGARFAAGCGAAVFAGSALVASVTPVAARYSPAPSLPPAPAVAAVVPVAPAPAAIPTAAAVPDLPAPPPVPPSRVATAPLGPLATTARTAPIMPIAPIAPAEPERGDLDYDRALAEYHRELRAYHAAERRYNRDLALYHRELTALSRDGNLANSGNTGNNGNIGNPGHPGRPAHGSQPAIQATLPTMPTMPTAPTDPTPLKPPQLGP
jgi:beta-lactamase regulating signal transducer with metallopeptidase domain